MSNNNGKNMLNNSYVPRSGGKRNRTRKNSKKSNVPFVSTLYTPIGKSVRLVKNVAGTGASLALTIPSKVLKSARKNTKKIAKRASKSAKRVSRNFMSSLGNMFKKTMKNFTN